MIYKVTKPQKPLQGTIKLPASKSICNRLQIIRAICPQWFEIGNMSDSDDAQVLKKALENPDQNEINIGHAGTSMRFLTAFLSGIEGERILTGSERMKERPIKILVDALRNIGAKIDYTEKEGYPPLKITGGKLKGGHIKIPANISSQYISALMMIAPLLENPLTIELEGKVLSLEYILMTLELMKKCSVGHIWQENKITISNTAYQPVNFIVESDWSAAAFWYEMVSMNKNAEITLEGLDETSLQGDSALPEVFMNIGVQTFFSKNEVILKNTTPSVNRYEYDFINQPDLAQAVTVSLVTNNIPFRLKGLDNLRIKETDRIAALKNELGKYGYAIDDSIENSLMWDNQISNKQEAVIETYHDHRMGMAFAPLALKYGSVLIDDPMVVNKSYPGFWEDLKKVGFTIENLR